MPRIEVSARIGAMIVEAAFAAGVPRAALAAATGFDPASAADPDARIPLELETALWEEAARLAGDGCFGLHAAERLRPGVFSVLDYAVRTAPTLRVALDRVARYNRLEHDLAAFTVVDRGPVTRVEHAFGDGGLVACRHAAEFTLASLVVIGGQVAGAPLRPLAAELQHPAPARAAEHERILGVLPRFGARVNALEFDRAAIEAPAPAADPALSAVIERHAEALLAALPPAGTSTADRVRRRLAGALRDGQATLEGVAAALRLSPRSLQRRLADEATTFEDVLDDARRELAERYLAEPRVAIAEVAYLVGYSEPSAFHRAFKRWTGLTPAEARRRTGAAAGAAR